MATSTYTPISTTLTDTTAELTRDVDWLAHPLGSPSSWPAALQDVLGTIQSSPEAMFLAWGPDRSFFCNDAYAALLEPGTTRMMGSPLAEIRSAGFERVYKAVEGAFFGHSSRISDMAVVLPRNGKQEQTWWTSSYSPISGDADTVAGVLCISLETTARVAGEKRVRDSEAWNRQIIDSATESAIIATDRQGRVTRWNEGARQLLGWSETEMLGQLIHRCFTPEDVAHGVADLEMQHALRDGSVPDNRWHLRKDASRFWGSGEMTVLRDATGEASGFVKVFRDRTTQRMEEEALRCAEGRLTLALDIASLGTFEWRAETSAMMLDERARQIFGLPLTGEVNSGCISDRIAETGCNAAPVQTGAIPESLTGASFWITINSGEKRHITSAGRFTPATEAGASPARMIDVFRDTTETKRLEQALQQANSQLRSDVTQRTAERDRLWDNSPDLLLVYGSDGTTCATNPAWTTLLGYESSELAGRIGLDLVHPDDLDSSRDALAASVDGRLPAFENRIRHKDGSYREIAWVAAPANGLVYATGRDVTAERQADRALRQAEEQLRHSQKIEALGQLTGGVAHDFNNLLTVIGSAVDLMKRPHFTDERKIRCITAITDAVDRGSKLAGQLLAFARRQDLKPEVFAVRDNIQTLNEMLRTLIGTGVEIITDLSTEPLFVNADPNQFDTAVVNLAVNARDAMNGAGRLTIQVGSVDGIPLAGDRDDVSGTFAAISVTDAGTGIPPENLERIFEPFFTTKKVGSGTGLGLSQVFGFARQSKGEVVVDSQVGKGTCFTLYLPLVAPTIPADTDV